MKVRAITVGLDPGFPLSCEKVAAAGRFAARVRAACEDAGVPVQTVRLATPPFPVYLRERTEAELVRFAGELERCCRENGIDYCALGPVNCQVDAEVRLLAILPTLIAETEAVFTSAVLGAGGQPARVSTARAIARVIRDIARATPGGFGNLRFAALVNCQPHIPFFPAAFHAGEPAFALALEAADVVAAVCALNPDLADVSVSLRRELEKRGGPLQHLAQRLEGQGFVFRGIDLSPAPGPEPEVSIAYAIERLGLGRFGEPGTLTAAALITVALKEMPEQKLVSANNEPGDNESDALNGVTVGDIDSAARSQFNIPDRVKGALITEVDPDSASYEAGLRPGDVIQEIDHKRVTNAAEAVEVSKHVKTKQVLVRFWSRGGSDYVVVDEGKSK